MSKNVLLSMLEGNESKFQFQNLSGSLLHVQAQHEWNHSPFAFCCNQCLGTNKESYKFCQSWILGFCQKCEKLCFPPTQWNPPMSQPRPLKLMSLSWFPTVTVTTRQTVSCQAALSAELTSWWLHSNLVSIFHKSDKSVNLDSSL